MVRTQPTTNEQLQAGDKWPFLTGTLLFSLVTTWLFTFCLELDFYRSHVQAEFSEKTLALPWRENALFFWGIWGKSLLVLFPILLISNLFSLRGYRKSRWFIFNLGLTLLYFWLLVDLYVHFVASNHALDYLQFLWNPDVWQWAGSDSPIASTLLLVLSVVGVMTLALTTLTRRFAKRLTNSWSRARTLQFASILTLIYSAAMFGYGIAIRQADESSLFLISILEEKLPVQPLFSISRINPDSSVSKQFSQTINAEYRLVSPLFSRAVPLDTDFVIPQENQPNIVIFVLESFRLDALQPSMTPKLSKLASSGLNFHRHYSNSNFSHFGLFSLLYGRLPLVFEEALDAQLPPQLCYTLKKSGYETTFISSGDCSKFQRMGEYLNERTFDKVITMTEAGMVDRDLRLLKLVENLAGQPSRGKPQLVVCFPHSTHFEYSFPPEFAIHKPFKTNFSFLSSEMIIDRDLIRNRYLNAAAFLDDKIAETISRLDLDNTIVVFTGDHGESFYEDGKLFHGSRLSDVQTQVPMVFLGKGVPQREISFATSHVDLVPTLFGLIRGNEDSISNCHGRNVLEVEPGSYADQVLLVHGVFNSHINRHHDRVVFIHDNLRLPLLISRKFAGVEILHPVDTSDRILTNHAYSKEEMEALSTGLAHEFRRIRSAVAQERRIPAEN